MTNWELRVAASAERQLSRFPERVAAAVVEFMIGPLRENPRRVGHPLQRELAGLWSARRAPTDSCTRSMTRRAPSPCCGSTIAPTCTDRDSADVLSGQARSRTAELPVRAHCSSPYPGGRGPVCRVSGRVPCACRRRPSWDPSAAGCMARPAARRAVHSRPAACSMCTLRGTGRRRTGDHLLDAGHLVADQLHALEHAVLVVRRGGAAAGRRSAA